MSLPTFTTCRCCGFEVDLTDSPHALVAKIGTDSRPVLCGRCGGPMTVTRLFPGLLTMPVTTFEVRHAMGQAATVRRGAPRA